MRYVDVKRISHNGILTVVSLFSGCGGTDLGFEGGFDTLEVSVNPHVHPDWIDGKHGNGWVRLKPTRYKTIFANDISRAAMLAWESYFEARGAPPGIFRLESIVEMVKRAKAGECGVFPSSVDVITGGFPCQDFSVAGKRKGFASHKNHRGVLLSEEDEPTVENRGKLYIWMKEVIEMLTPKVFVAENVKGLVNLSDAKTIIEEDFRSINSGGYVVVSAKVLRAAEYGVPQTRERVFFLGFLKSALKPTALEALQQEIIPEEFDPYPVPTHKWRGESPHLNDDNALMPAVTVRQSILDLPEPEDTNGDLSQSSYSKARWYGRHCQGQTEVNLDQPGPTIRAEHHGNIEFRRLDSRHEGRIEEEIKGGFGERRLTVRECARLQTFPDDYQFVQKGADKDRNISASVAYKLVGNAVPPLLAYHIARRLQDLWPVLFEYKGDKVKHRDPKTTSKIMSRIRGKNTKAEVLMGKAMWSLGLRYRKHYKLEGKPDFVLVSAKIAVFCDGDFWHGNNWRLRGYEKMEDDFKNSLNKEFWIKKIRTNMERDKGVNEGLRAAGWTVLRFWESDIKKDPMNCAQKVLEAKKSNENGVVKDF